MFAWCLMQIMNAKQSYLNMYDSQWIFQNKGATKYSQHFITRRKILKGDSEKKMSAELKQYRISTSVVRIFSKGGHIGSSNVLYCGAFQNDSYY